MSGCLNCAGCLTAEIPKMNSRTSLLNVNLSSAFTRSLLPINDRSPKQVGASPRPSNTRFESAASFAELLTAPPTANADSRVRHLLVANALGIGHYTPVVNFVQLILSRSLAHSNNVRITFISPVRATEARGSVPPVAHPYLHFVRVELDGPDVHPVNMNAMLTRREELQGHIGKALRHSNEEFGWPQPCAVIHDMFAVYAQEYADDILKIPRVLFNTSHTLVFSLMSAARYRPALWSDSGMANIPGFHREARLKMAWAMLNTGEKDPVLDRSDLMGILARSIAIVSNDLPSVFPQGSQLTQEVNVQFRRAVEKRDSVTLPPLAFLPIAPLCMMQPPQPPKEHDQIMSWLSEQPARSVIFIALGTLYDISLPALKAMAGALEISARRFLWAYRLPSKGVLTEEYKKRNGRRGRVASWVDQRAVLGHPAIRVFVTHGGWNSCVESFAYGGVPMICVPLGAEQAVNAMLLSDGLGVAEVALVETDERSELTFAEREELAAQMEAKGPMAIAPALQNSWWRSCNCEEWLRLLKRVCDTEYEELYERARLTHIQTLKACAPQGQMMQSADGLISLISNLL